MQRLNYTVIGVAVNTAARLQDQTKFHAWSVLISGQVYNIVKDEIAAEFVEEHLFKGKQEPVRIDKVLGIKQSLRMTCCIKKMLDDGNQYAYQL